jgi:hypothetical protein
MRMSSQLTLPGDTYFPRKQFASYLGLRLQIVLLDDYVYVLYLRDVGIQNWSRKIRKAVQFGL